jgi:hypothetical protein
MTRKAENKCQFMADPLGFAHDDEER